MYTKIVRQSQWRVFNYKMEPSDPVDKYTVSRNKDNLIVGHSPLDKNRKFSRTIFYFLGTYRYAKCEVVITRKAVNLGDGYGNQVSLH